MGALLPAETPGRRIVVVSPHLDDGVLSLGAAIAAWSRAGARVELLTVLGCDPASEAPAGGWDRRGGFATEGASARARREEDRRACAILGATPVWLPFGSVDYERHGDEADVRRAAVEAVGAADRVLLPGSPLSHPDHEWLVQTLVADGLDRGSVALYAEQPYTRRAGAGPHAPPWLASAVGPSAFAPVPHSSATATRSGVRSGATGRSCPCSGWAGAYGVGRTASPSLPSWSPGARTNLPAA